MHTALHCAVLQAGGWQAAVAVRRHLQPQPGRHQPHPRGQRCAACATHLPAPPLSQVPQSRTSRGVRPGLCWLPWRTCPSLPDLGQMHQHALVLHCAAGVRNTVGFDFHPTTGRLYFTDNGRDGLGDNMPDCELNVVTKPGGHPFLLFFLAVLAVPPHPQARGWRRAAGTIRCMPASCSSRWLKQSRRWLAGWPAGKRQQTAPAAAAASAVVQANTLGSPSATPARWAGQTTGHTCASEGWGPP